MEAPTFPCLRFRSTLASGAVRVFNRSTIALYARNHADVRQSVFAWFHEVEKATWAGPDDIRRMYPSASFVKDRVVFRINGNACRIIAMVKYEFHAVYIRFIGTHAEYDKTDAASV